MKINKQFGMKLVMLLSALFCVNAASADNVLSVAPFTIDSYDTVDMQICLDNSDPIGAFQVEIVLPDELEIAGKPVLNADRKAAGMTVQASKLYGVVSNLLKNFKGNTGAIMSVPVKVKDGMLADKTVTIGMKQVVLSSGDGELGVEQPDFEVEVTLVGETYKYEGAIEPAEITIMPGERKEVALSMTNNGPIWGFQIDAFLPEGLSIDEESGETAERCSEDGFVLISDNGAKGTRIALVTYGENSVKDDTFEGDVIKFTLVASEDFAAEKAEVTFGNFIVTYASGLSVKDCPVSSLAVINGKVEADRQAANKAAYDAVVAEINALQESLDAALATIEQENPDAPIADQKEAAQAAIDAARQGADDALAAVAEEGTFDYTVDTEAIEALITAVVEAGKTSGIDAIAGDAATGNAAVYTLDGIKLEAPQRGKVNVIITTNGDVKKVLVK